MDPVATQLPINRPVAFRLCLTADLALSWIVTIFLFVNVIIIAKEVTPVYLITVFTCILNGYD
jgi:hypothetical protein